jgi:hypothetical protein
MENESTSYIILVNDLIPLQENDTCPICLEKYKKKELLKKLPCFHIFHRSCLKKIKICPLCRKFFK